MILKIILAFLVFNIIAIIIVIIESARENKQVRITKYEINTDKINKDYRIALISDYHNSTFPEDNKAIKEILDNSKISCILIPGDMVTCRKKYMPENYKSMEAVNSFAKYAPVYYSFGNHELGCTGVNAEVGDVWNSLEDKLSSKVTVLKDKCVEAPDIDNIKIYGLNIDRKYYRRLENFDLPVEELNDKLGVPDSNSFNIMLAHSPEYFTDYAKWGADLIVSGHNHGGLVRIPLLGGAVSPKYRIFPKYDYGRYETENSIMILSCGIGAHSLRIRVNNIPEVVIIDLKSSK